MRQRTIDPVHDLTVVPQELAFHVGVGGQQGSIHRGHSSSTNEEMLWSTILAISLLKSKDYKARI